MRGPQKILCVASALLYADCFWWLFQIKLRHPHASWLLRGNPPACLFCQVITVHSLNMSEILVLLPVLLNCYTRGKCEACTYVEIAAFLQYHEQQLRSEADSIWVCFQGRKLLHLCLGLSFSEAPILMHLTQNACKKHFLRRTVGLHTEFPPGRSRSSCCWLVFASSPWEAFAFDLIRRWEGSCVERPPG